MRGRGGWLVAIAIYAGLSLACFSGFAGPAARMAPGAAWLLGPPALLLYGRELIWLYAICTVPLGLLVMTAKSHGWPRPNLPVLGLAGALWCSAGALVYIPSW